MVALAVVVEVVAVRGVVPDSCDHLRSETLNSNKCGVTQAMFIEPKNLRALGLREW